MPPVPRKRKTKIQRKAGKLKLRSGLPDDLTRPMPIQKFAKAYNVDASTVWRGLENGTLKFITLNKRRLVLPPAIEQNPSAD